MDADSCEKFPFYFWHLKACLLFILSKLSCLFKNCSKFSGLCWSSLFCIYTLLRIYLQPISATSIIVAHSSAPWSFRWSSLLEPRAFTRLKFRLQFRILSSANFKGVAWMLCCLDDHQLGCKGGCAFRSRISASFANWRHPSSKPSTKTCVKHFSLQNFS